MNSYSINSNGYDDMTMCNNNNNGVSLLQRENYILKNKLNELMRVNEDLVLQINELHDTKKELLLALKRIDALQNELHDKECELQNNEKILKEFYTKSNKDNTHISTLEIKIEKMNEQLKQNNNEINTYQNDIIAFKSEVEGLRVMKSKYYALMEVLEKSKKENTKLKKNLELFAKENHFAAVKIKELEMIVQNKIEMKLNDKDDGGKNNKNVGSKETQDVNSIVNNQQIKSVVVALINKINTLKAEVDSFKEKNNLI